LYSPRITSPTDDRTLVAAAQGGDRGALDSLLRRHYDRIHAVCRRITGNEADAADAAQEAMIAMVRSLARFDGRSSFGTWAYRIATNASLDELRRRRRRPSVDWGAHDDGGPAHELVDPAAGPQLDAVADRMALDAALAALPEDFRVPVVLRDVADLDYAEIAAVLDIPIGTVKSRIARGRGALAAALRTGHRPGGAFDGPERDDGNRNGGSRRPSGTS
jgi:RNA polymerase sigma-70 factor (ECF subfamily)